ncbi:MAG TPA: hypothetical protein VLS48_00130 [Anaerolineales bacterium]|nr:hypothetical protein [Anaerolineales bacterium]
MLSDAMQPVSVPQLKVRSNVRAGATPPRGPSNESLDQCNANVEYWQQSFRDSYNQSVRNGRRPPFNNPL